MTDEQWRSEFEDLNRQKRALMVALAEHLKDRHRINYNTLTDMKQGPITDFMRARGTADRSVFEGLFKKARPLYESFDPWAKAAFLALYGSPPESLPVREREPGGNVATFFELFRHAETDDGDLERTASVYAGIYALYRYRAQTRRHREGEGPQEHLRRERLEISKIPEKRPRLRFEIFSQVSSAGEAKPSASGFITLTPNHLYLIGQEHSFKENLVLVLPRFLEPFERETGLMLRRHISRGFFASRLLLKRAPKGKEQDLDFQPGFVSSADLEDFEKIEAKLSNAVLFEGHSVLMIRD